MVVIGLAGGSGTGKTTVARGLAKRLSARGVGHIDADAVAHDLLDGDKEVNRRLRERFGDSIITGGKIDRKKLGAIVFGSDKALLDLNAIVHPAVVAACRKRVEEFGKAGAGVVIVDAALLLDVPVPKVSMGIDYVIALRSPREEQVRRLLEGGGATRDEIEARLNHQDNLEKSFYRADVVVDTNRPLSEVVDQIAMIVEGLLNGDEADGRGR